MGFSNPITGGEDLIRSGIRSPNYVAGVAGWRIAQDGSAEFNNVTVRGTLATGAIQGPVTLAGDLTMIAGGRILTAAAGPRIVLSSAVAGTAQFFTGDAAETNTPYITESVQGAAGQHTAFMGFSSGQLASKGDAYLQLNAGRQDGGRAAFAQFWCPLEGPDSYPIPELLAGPSLAGGAAGAGLIIQAGTQVVTFAGANGNLTFPNTFPNGLLTVLVSNGDGGAALDVVLDTVIGNVGGCGINAVQGGAFFTGNVRVNFVAIGW